MGDQVAAKVNGDQTVDALKKECKSEVRLSLFEAALTQLLYNCCWDWVPVAVSDDVTSCSSLNSLNCVDFCPSPGVPILIYQGVHCCTKVCNLHLDDSPSKSRDNRKHWTRCNLLEWKGIYNNCEPFTDQLQPIYFTCNGLQTKPIGFKYKLSKVWRIVLCNPMKVFFLFQLARAGRRPVIGWKH